MSGKLPLFASAPLCKIAITMDGKETPIAYAVGLSVNVGINLQEIRVLGQYEVEAIEPLAMMPVTGSFQVIRLLTEATRKTTRELAKEEAGSLVRTIDEVKDVKGLSNDAIITNSVESDGGTGALTGSSELAKHLDPRTILLSKSFDITIKMKTQKVESGKAMEWTEAVHTTMMVIKDCRLSGASASLSPGALLTESVEFQGLLAVRYGSNGLPVEKNGISVHDLK